MVDSHNQAVTVQASRGGSTWMCTRVYASLVPHFRLQCWEHLQGLRRSVTIPWIMIGDFNDSMWPTNQRGGVLSMVRSESFRNMVDSCNLLDIHPKGNKYTWVRKRGGMLVMFKKLDWCFMDPPPLEACFS